MISQLLSSELSTLLFDVVMETFYSKIKMADLHSALEKWNARGYHVVFETQNAVQWK